MTKNYQINDIKAIFENYQNLIIALYFNTKLLVCRAQKLITRKNIIDINLDIKA